MKATGRDATAGQIDSFIMHEVQSPAEEARMTLIFVGATRL